MTRRVGFGDEPPESGGGFPWTALVVAGVVIAAAVAVFDADTATRLRDWALGSEDQDSRLFPILLGLGVVIAGGWILRRAWRALTASRNRPSRSAAPPVRGRSAPAQTPPPPIAERGAPPQAAPATTSQVETSQAVQQAGGCFAIVFLIVWLCGWTAGIVFAIGAFATGFAGDAAGVHWFLLVWIAFALIGWVVAARMLLGLIRNAFAGR